MERKKNRPLRVELQSDEGALVVAWKAGGESRYALADLRRACPCAVCRELRSKPQATGGLVLLEEAAATATAEATRLDQIGRYGVRITWADGHDTGIYTYDTLRDLDSERDS
jgi:DUF971 family protein